MTLSPFWFWTQKSIVLFSCKGIRERHFYGVAFNFNLMCCLGGGQFTRSSKRVEALAKSSNLIVNSVTLSRDLPAVTGFFEIIYNNYGRNSGKYQMSYRQVRNYTLKIFKMTEHINISTKHSIRS